MRRLMLLRHAKADRPSPMLDEERPLNERGTTAARRMGGYMARHQLIPDLVVCSTARRTRDTLAQITPQWPASITVAFEERLYLAPLNIILEVIRSQPKQVANLLVIGHNPGLHQAAELLTASVDVAQRERLREKFPTGALAVIDFAVPAWTKLHTHSGRLDRFVTPRSITAATN